MSDFESYFEEPLDLTGQPDYGKQPYTNTPGPQFDFAPEDYTPYDTDTGDYDVDEPLAEYLRDLGDTPANPMAATEYRKTEIALENLQRLAEQCPVSARQLTYGELPKIESSKIVGPRLETAFLENPEQERLLYYGDGHGLIFPFLSDAVKKGFVQLPLGQVLNVDYHADISFYTENVTSHTTSWQRYGVDQGLWYMPSSYNWQPEHPTATIIRDFNPDQFIQSVSAEQAAGLQPDLLSVDLDFFNDLRLGDPKFLEYLDTLKRIISNSKCVFVFSSSGWTGDRVTSESLGIIVENIQSTFCGED